MVLRRTWRIMNKSVDIEKVNEFSLLKEEVAEHKEIKLSQWF